MRTDLQNIHINQKDLDLFLTLNDKSKLEFLSDLQREPKHVSILKQLSKFKKTFESKRRHYNFKYLVDFVNKDEIIFTKKFSSLRDVNDNTSKRLVAHSLKKVNNKVVYKIKDL